MSVQGLKGENPSIGYSTCHWCHVMERESFEDEEVAAILNESYISIKVDREERPDIDNFYMNICQAMTGQGGWPLTVIMTPEKNPFFTGTYFPKYSRYGMPGLMDILQQVRERWREDPETLIETGRDILESIKENNMTARDGELQYKVLDKAYVVLMKSFDKRYGGFGHMYKGGIFDHVGFGVSRYSTDKKWLAELVYWITPNISWRQRKQ